MNSQSFAFSPEEQRIRRWWLALLFVRVAVPFVLLLLALTDPAYQDPQAIAKLFLGPGGKMSIDGQSVNIFQAIMIGSAAVAVTALLLYIFAYRKRGTLLLTVVLIFGAIHLLGFFAAVVKGEATLYSWIDGATYLAWYVLSFKLRKINKKMVEAARLSQYEGVRPLIVGIEQAVSADDLSFKYREAVAQMPQMESLFTEKYQERKKALQGKAPS